MKRTESLEEYLAESQKRVASRIAAIGEVADAAIVKHHERDQWHMILPDVDGAGMWRLQTFDQKGFIGHSLFNGKDEAIRDAARSGYYVRDDGALDRLQRTPAFIRGSYALDLLGKVNTGALSAFDAHALLMDYDNRLAA